ncbi:hypothetical protein FQA39_LY08301 [Lamprigera yunnana]|nr:hypothetical protein FQA39_LY08301 [Lamprigera yunnana]
MSSIQNNQNIFSRRITRSKTHLQSSEKRKSNDKCEVGVDIGKNVRKKDNRTSLRRCNVKIRSKLRPSIKPPQRFIDLSFSQCATTKNANMKNNKTSKSVCEINKRKAFHQETSQENKKSKGNSTKTQNVACQTATEVFALICILLLKMESDHDLLFSTEDEALEHSGSDSETDYMSDEKSSDDDIFALARFPKKNLNIFNAWITAIQNPVLASKSVEEVYLSYYVCGRHFAPESHVPGTLRGLMVNAVPSLFLPDWFARFQPEKVNAQQPYEVVHLLKKVQSQNCKLTNGFAMLAEGYEKILFPNNYVIIYKVEKGRALVEVQLQKKIFKPQQSFYIPLGSPYSIQNVSRNERLVLFFNKIESL